MAKKSPNASSSASMISTVKLQFEKKYFWFESKEEKEIRILERLFLSVMNGFSKMMGHISAKDA